MTTNNHEARGVREDAERIWHDFNKQYYEPVELIAYALHRDRESRDALGAKEDEEPTPDAYLISADDEGNVTATGTYEDTLGAKLERLGKKATGWTWDKSTGGLMYTTLPRLKVFPDFSRYHDTPDEAADKALEEQGDYECFGDTPTPLCEQDDREFYQYGYRERVSAEWRIDS